MLVCTQRKCWSSNQFHMNNKQSKLLLAFHFYTPSNPPKYSPVNFLTLPTDHNFQHAPSNLASPTESKRSRKLDVFALAHTATYTLKCSVIFRETKLSSAYYFLGVIHIVFLGVVHISFLGVPHTIL